MLSFQLKVKSSKLSGKQWAMKSQMFVLSLGIQSKKILLMLGVLTLLFLILFRKLIWLTCLQLTNNLVYVIGQIIILIEIILITDTNSKAINLE
jgi:hypothetical protein